MIRIQRPELAAEIEAYCKAERLKAEDHFHVRKLSNDFKFAAYKHPGIVQALKEVFHGKCAYCESKFGVVQPADVEHFRPKGAVIIDSKIVKPGYFWLAATWTNLLPSCIFCNRVNRHEDIEPPIEGPTSTDLVPANKYKPRDRSQGKGNHFPLENERGRTIDLMKFDAEVPLLLNPCEDDPAEHLAFNEDGEISPRLMPDGTPSVRGSTTIDVLALDRPDLNAARLETSKRVMAELQLLIDFMEAEPRDDERIGVHLEKLETYLQPSSVYVALVRDVIDLADDQLRPHLSELRARFPSRPTRPFSKVDIVGGLGKPAVPALPG